MHPRSLANLEGGRKPWTAERRARRVGDHVSPEDRRRISAAGARARVAKQMTALERQVLQVHGPRGLGLFRLGYRVGYNRAYLRWKAWGDQLLGRTRSHRKAAKAA
jgi:hypothetical protein